MKATLAAAAAAMVCAAASEATTFTAKVGGNNVQFTPFADNSVRIQIAPPGNSIVDPPLSALYLEKPPTTFTAVRKLENGIVNGNLVITLDSTTGFVTATRQSDNTVLVTQTALSFAAPTSPGTRSGSVSATTTFSSVASERVYGLGEHRTGTVEMLGSSGTYFKLFQDSQYYSVSRGGDVSIPWYMSSNGYGFVWNSPSYGYVDMVRGQGFTWMSNATLNVDFWITTTPAPVGTSSPAMWTSLMSNYIDAVGHAPRMPFYSTGFIQCKDRYRNQSQILAVAQGYVERNLPISVIVQDWFHWVNMGDWSFNPICFPDPQGMVDQLGEQGITFKITFWPFQTPQSQHWQEFSSNGYLAIVNGSSTTPWPDGSYYLYDSTNPAARQAMFNAYMAGYGRYGIKTIWLDAAEPERTASDPMFGLMKFQAGTDAEIGEAWIQQHVRAFADGFASQNISGDEYYVLPRHAWAGSWRYSAGLWSGDIQSTFDELAIQIKVAQGVALSGVALWTTDIGGYWGGNPADPQFQDLIVRWFQFGAFCPLFRLHGHRQGGPGSDECGDTNGDNEVWNLAPDPTHYNGIVTVMRLREQLRQYVADINAETADTGIPMIRPMFLAFPADPACQGADVEDQYMFGPQWLVAPQYTYQATSRSVYLPALDANHTWVYYYNQSSVGPGGARVDVPTPIDEFPLFYIAPVPPVTPPVLANITSLWSATRQDQVLCLSSQCYGANNPTGQPTYVPIAVEGVGIVTPGSAGMSISVNGVSYPLVPLNLAYSEVDTDNFVATNTTYPDPTYSAPGSTDWNNGYALAQAAPGSLPLQVFSKTYGSRTDYATFASTQGVAWANSNGYTFRYISGYILTQ